MQLPLNSTAIFELLIQVNFGARLLPGVAGGLMLFSDSSLDFHAMFVTVSPVDILKVLEIG